MAIKLIDPSGNSIVSSNYNATDKALAVNLPTNQGYAGFVAGLVEMAPATDPFGTRYTERLMTSIGRRLRIATDQVVFNHSFESTTAGSYRQLFRENATTMTSTTTGGAYVLNNGNTTTASTNINITTYRTFPLFGGATSLFQMWGRTINEDVANSVIEMGVGFVSASSAPTDGAFFRWTASGLFNCVVNYNGVEILNSGSLTAPTTVDNHRFTIYAHNDAVLFYIDGQLYSKIELFGNTTPSPFSSSFQPMFARVYNTGAVPSLAKRLEIGFMAAYTGDQDTNKPWPHVMAGMGNNAINIPVGSLASGGTANYANSAAPASATLSNTTAGYTTLGGQFQFAAPAGVETDYALYAYQVPIGSSILPGRTLYISRIHISAYNTGAVASAVTPTVMQWALGVGSTAVTLATAEGANTRATRRIPIGTMSIPVNAIIGATADRDLDMAFDVPLVVENATYVHVLLKIPIGVATASQVIRGTVGIVGYFD